MHSKRISIRAVLIALCLSVQLIGQNIPDFKLWAAAQKLREDTAVAVANGGEKPSTALAKLKGSKVPFGLTLDHDADFAFAAVDVGHRLLALRKPVEAEQFLVEAEDAFYSSIRKTDDRSAHEKAMFLQQLAFIRGRYLNKVAQAKTDLEQAIALQPDDLNLQKAKDTLVNQNPEIFENETPAKGEDTP